jgi:ABC-type transport system substrate-binding protein
MEHNAYAMQGVQGNFQLIFGPIYAAPDPDQNFHFWSKTTAADDGAIGINFSAYATDTSEEALVRGRATEDVGGRKDAYADFITELNEHAVNIWMYFTPYSLVTNERVHGLAQAKELPFGNFQPKTWWGSVWVTT